MRLFPQNDKGAGAADLRGLAASAPWLLLLAGLALQRAGVGLPGAPIVTAEAGGIPMAADRQGNVYVAVEPRPPAHADYAGWYDQPKFRTPSGWILRITPSLHAERIAGARGPGTAGAGRPALETRVRPYALAVDERNRVLFAQGNGVFRIGERGIVEKVLDETKVEALAAGAGGRLYFSRGTDHRVWMAKPGRAPVVAAGTGVKGSSGDGGPAIRARLIYVLSLAVGPAGDLYLLDLTRVRRVDRAGTIRTVVTRCDAMAVDAAGRLYVADRASARVYRVEGPRLLTTVAGWSEPGCTGDGKSAVRARISMPYSLAVDGLGRLHIACARHDAAAIRTVDARGRIRTTYAPESVFYYW